LASALDGVTILDLSRDMAGAYAAMLLAEQGAECIKIVSPGADGERPPTFALFDRSKRSLTLDPETNGGQEVFRRLVARADIMVEDECGPSPRRFMDYDALARLNPRLVYCSITPFGEKGPLKDKPGDWMLVAAFAGTFGAQGGLSQPPVFVFLPLGAYGTALLTAYGATLALFTREATGRGQRVDTSLLSGTLAMEAGGFLSAVTITPVASTRSIQQGVLPAYRLYPCKDDRWIMIACGNTTFWNKFCLAMDRTDLLSDPRFEGMPWALANVENRLALTDVIAGILKEKTLAEWLDIFVPADVPCAPVNTREEFMDDPQVQVNHMIVEVEDRHLGRMRQMGVPLTLTDYPGSIKSPAPRPGEHTAAILGELGYTPPQIDGLKREGAV